MKKYIIDDYIIKINTEVQNRNENKSSVGVIDGAVFLSQTPSIELCTFRLTHLEINERKNAGLDFCDLFMQLAPNYSKIKSFCISDCERWKSAFLNCVHGRNCEYVHSYIESIMVFDWIYAQEGFANDEFYNLILSEVLYYFSSACEYFFVLPKEFFSKSRNGLLKQDCSTILSYEGKKIKISSFLEKLGFRRIKTTQIYALDTQCFRQNVYTY